MERLFLECVIRALLLVGLTVALLYVMRVKDAVGKHRVWTGVMVLMLFLPVWATSGPKVSLRLLPPLSPVTASGPVVPIGSFKAPVVQSLRLSNWELLGVSVTCLASACSFFGL